MPSRSPLDALSLVLGSVEAVRNLRALYVLLATFAIAGMLTAMAEASLARGAGWWGPLQAGAALFVAFYGTRLCIATWNQSISELPWLPVGVTYSPLPIGAAATLLFVIERMVFGVQSQRATVRIEETLVEAHDQPDVRAV